MGLKFFSFFVLFFALSSIFLFYQKSETLIYKPKNKKAPLMEFRDIKSYDITFNGVEGVLQAKSAKRFRNKDELYNIYTTKFDKGYKEELWADKGVWRRNILNLFGHVLYKDDLQKSLSSDKVTYNVKKDILSSSTAFFAKYKNSTLRGSSFKYYLKRKKLFAKNIKAEIYMEKR